GPGEARSGRQVVAARRRLLRWGIWFALLNLGLLVLVGARYLWYYLTLGPSPGWIYATLAFVGQMSIFAYLPFLILVPVILLLPWPRLVLPVAVLFGTTVLRDRKSTRLNSSH